MVKQIVVFSILLLPFISEGQQQYFNRRYDFNSSHVENGFDIIPYDTGYMTIVSSSGNSSSAKRGVYICFLDSVGILTQVKSYIDTSTARYLGSWGSICKLQDGGYAFAGTVNRATLDPNATLFRLDHYGDTLWTREYGDTVAYQAGWQCKHTRDGGFIITGITYTYSQYGDILLIKTDSSGIQQWQRHFGGTDYDLAFSIDTCVDGGFILAGITYSYAPHALSEFANAYLVKTDSMGNFEWQKVLGGFFNDEFESVIQARDSFIYAFGEYCFIDDSVFCCSGMNKPYIVKIDIAGNIQWEKYYGDSLFDLTMRTAEEFPNGDMVCGGFTSDSTFFSDRGFILRINTQGDNIFYNTYEGLHSANTFSYLYDVTADKDDGYICTGDLVPAIPDTGTQDIWILKLDSNGCEEINCLGTSVPDFYISQNELLFSYPNPAFENLSIEVNAPLTGKCSLEISDLYGRAIKNISLENGYNLIQINITSLKAGVYFENLLSENRVISTARLLKSD